MWQQPMNIKIKLLKKIRQLINNQKKKIGPKGIKQTKEKENYPKLN